MSQRHNRVQLMTMTDVAPAPATPIPWWVRAAVIVGALLMTAGAVLALANPAMLVSPHDEINGAVHIYAGYLASRNLAMALLLVILLSLSAKRALGNLMILVALIQLLDACIDCAEHRWPIVPGVLLLGLLFLFAAAKLSSYPVWKAEFWTR